MFRDFLHKGIDFVCEDAKKNTLTNIVVGVSGGVAGGVKANKLANVGFTMLERNVGQKTVGGAISGAVGAITANTTCSGTVGPAKPFKLADKVANIEKWFDGTRVGAAIDNEISYVQHRSHAIIDRTFK